MGRGNDFSDGSFVGGRGRRVMLPDESTVTTARGRCNARVAWLLVTNRVLGSRPELARRKPFLDALSERGRKVDASTVSRWETGVIDVRDQTVSLYEEVLGLPVGALVAVSSGLRRTLVGEDPGPQRRPTDELLEFDLEATFDRVDSGSGTGGDWLFLTRVLKEFDFVRLRRDEWGGLAHRLVRELGPSVGMASVRRYEATVDLLRRPEAVHHVTEAIGEFVSSPHAQYVFPVLNALSEIDDPRAGTLVTGLLDSANPVVRRTAAWVAAVRLARGLDAQDGRALEAHVIEELRAAASIPDLLEFANVAAHLPAESWARIRTEIPNDERVDMVDGARSRGELLVKEEIRSIIDEMASTAVAQTPTPVAISHDPMLRTMLREAVLHVDGARRFQAMVTIGGTPYAPAVARIASTLAHSQHPVLAARLLELLINLGGAGAGDEPVKSALAEDREAIRARALIAIGVRPVELHADADSAIVGLTVDAAADMDRAAGLIALGLSGSASLDQLAEHRDLGAAARWWHTTGPARHDPDALAHAANF